MPPDLEDIAKSIEKVARRPQAGAAAGRDAKGDMRRESVPGERRSVGLPSVTAEPHGSATRRRRPVAHGRRAVSNAAPRRRPSWSHRTCTTVTGS